MNNFEPYEPRSIIVMPTLEQSGWQLKRYAIAAKNKTFDQATAKLAFDAGIDRLPVAGNLCDQSGNHGVGFQIVHFAQVAVVSPVFFWMWGSVLANIDQMRAPWSSTNQFKTGVKEVVGCVWEMQLVCFETQAWTQTMLGEQGTSTEKLARYLECCPVSAEKQ